MFRDRIEAGLQLAEKLRKYQGDPGVVIAVPRGGVPVAYAMAKEPGFPMDLILVKKPSHPMDKEFAIGAVTLTDEFVIPHPEASQEYIDDEIDSIRKKLKEMYPKFARDKNPLDLKGKTIIVIDDGIATGNTLLLTAEMLKKAEPLKIVIAAPVASPAAVQKLRKEVDDVVAVLMPHAFTGVGAFYEDFEQVTDDEVIYYLEKLRKEMKKTG